MIIVGERINGTRPAIQQALAARDEPALVAEARCQWEAGASTLEVNTAPLLDTEVECMTWMVNILTARLLFGEDPGGKEYLAAFRQGRLNLDPAPPMASPRA